MMQNNFSFIKIAAKIFIFTIIFSFATSNVLSFQGNESIENAIIPAGLFFMSFADYFSLYKFSNKKIGIVIYVSLLCSFFAKLENGNFHEKMLSGLFFLSNMYSNLYFLEFIFSKLF